MVFDDEVVESVYQKRSCRQESYPAADGYEGKETVGGGDKFSHFVHFLSISITQLVSVVCLLGTISSDHFGCYLVIFS